MAELNLGSDCAVYCLKRTSRFLNTSSLDYSFLEINKSDANFFLNYGYLINSTNIMKQTKDSV